MLCGLGYGLAGVEKYNEKTYGRRRSMPWGQEQLFSRPRFYSVQRYSLSNQVSCLNLSRRAVQQQQGMQPQEEIS